MKSFVLAVLYVIHRSGDVVCPWECVVHMLRHNGIVSGRNLEKNKNLKRTSAQDMPHACNRTFDCDWDL